MIDEVRAKKYCKEDISKIENYDKAIADTTQTWICHHRTEIWWNCSQKELIENECYYHRKALELIFMTRLEHDRLHKTGKKHSAEARNKMSEAAKGRPSQNKGKTLSDEQRKKISESLKGRPSPTRGKPRSEETKKKIAEAGKAYWAKRKEGGK